MVINHQLVFQSEMYNTQGREDSSSVQVEIQYGPYQQTVNRLPHLQLVNVNTNLGHWKQENT